ncbi:Serine/threonine-protein phosphatase 2A 55 kDa regulatory subunit B [Fasciola gigantica]|uniref:Serine/threonine-protein phosphatase 2A 55 kDa regulatory subunit B n=1 Tax=Fasciola gigantica TaxID=46835 RepID=A0A504YZ36_FASGI|nr:Serine/threonine-protein phosphatase 2A 55 kDa regulatory subunit B [Fasciola gigantica]
MEDLSEVITAAQFHPSACSLFVYSSSKGTARLCDMRERALCDKHAANIVDIKPNNMEDLSEVITAAQFHPSACSLFVYSSSKGTARLCDMRERALCDKHAASKFFLSLRSNVQVHRKSSSWNDKITEVFVSNDSVPDHF